jgi:glycosyltransferase involved in cell wall biosynthesis
VKLSIVTTLYRSVATIDEFYRRIMAAATPIAEELELVMVNDGSPDNSLDLALALHRGDPRVVVVDPFAQFRPPQGDDDRPCARPATRHHIGHP